LIDDDDNGEKETASGC